MLECPYCKEALIWQNDYEIDDYVCGEYHCPNCKVDVTITLMTPEEEEEDGE